MTRTAISPRFAINTLVIGLGTASYPKRLMVRERTSGVSRRVNGGTRFSTAEWFTEIDSTNRYLADAARAGAADGRVAVADVQLAGRGRLDRQWHAPAGSSLLVSVLVRPRLRREHWAWLTSAAGLAAVETVTACCDLPARMKWPNDVVLEWGPRAGKLAGVLAEAVGDAIVIGMGLNVDWQSVPDELEGVATAVSLAGGRVVARGVLLAEWLGRLDRHLGRLERAPGRGAAELRQAHRRHSATLGRRVRAELPGAAVGGTAVDIDEQGALVIQRDDGGGGVGAADGGGAGGVGAAGGGGGAAGGGALTTVGAGDIIHLR